MQPFCGEGNLGRENRGKENIFAVVDAVKPDIIVFDVREKVEAKVFSQLKQKGFFIFLLDSDDEQAAKVVDYHVRTLPYPPSLDAQKKSMANLFGPAYLPIEPLKKNAAVRKRKTKKILVYLGSFSARRELLQSYLEQFQKTVLLEKFWLAGSEGQNNFDKRSSARLMEIDFQWTFVVEGNASHRKEIKRFFLQGMESCLKKNQKNLIEVFGILDQKKNYQLISSSDLFLTHFGLSFLQAIDMGRPTGLLLPTRYHSELSEFHFPNCILQVGATGHLLHRAALGYGEQIMLGQKRETLAKVMLAIPPKKPKNVVGNNAKKIDKNNIKAATQSAAKKNVVVGISGGGTATIKYLDCISFSCPYCSSKDFFVLHRKPHFSWVCCNKCKSASQQRYGLEKFFPENLPNYSSNYFQKEYEKSYGKTYKQDEANIKKMATLRLAHIKQLLGSAGAEKKWVLDIGAAYGFFLDVAFQNGFSTAGVEISKHAARFIAPSHRMFFGDVEKLNFKNLLKSCKTDHFEIISMWYVIEHFPSLDSLLKNISMGQKKGDVFALSTPNFQGISARKNTEAFVETSPPDHFHLFSAKGLAELFGNYNYRLVKIVSTGIHKQRYRHFFPYLSKILPFPFYRFFARKNNLGDTMELYFLKK